MVARPYVIAFVIAAPGATPAMGRASQGFTRATPTAITILAMVAGFALLSISMKTLPLGTAYTVWTGIGAIGALVVGVMALGEPLTEGRALAAALIVAGLTLMKLTRPPTLQLACVDPIGRDVARQPADSNGKRRGRGTNTGESWDEE